MCWGPVGFPTRKDVKKVEDGEIMDSPGTFSICCSGGMVTTMTGRRSRRSWNLPCLWLTSARYGFQWSFTFSWGRRNRDAENLWQSGLWSGWCLERLQNHHWVSPQWRRPMTNEWCLLASPKESAGVFLPKNGNIKQHHRRRKVFGEVNVSLLDKKESGAVNGYSLS